MAEHDPLKHPERIPLDAWETNSLQMVAECEGCGLAPRFKCLHCERHAPRLSLKVVLDDDDVVSN